MNKPFEEWYTDVLLPATLNKPAFDSDLPGMIVSAQRKPAVKVGYGLLCNYFTLHTSQWFKPYSNCIYLKADYGEVPVKISFVTSEDDVSVHAFTLDNKHLYHAYIYNDEEGITVRHISKAFDNIF